MFLELGFWFVAIAALALIAAILLRKIRLATALPALGLGLLVMMVLTAIFDNVMIAAGLFDYGEQTLLGLRIGRAPLEDFLYPLCSVLLMPALWWLFGGKQIEKVNMKRGSK
ncbi:lycopene cyclase domain-containing protein [Glutamicibacter arilaitensis]|uniref:lycopene cyclase domain-containing protein n=1 Tax=Glutamicibacter arilaitensis TaxID=256701 RepID=UPI00384D5A56